MSNKPTREQIIEAADRLFYQQGFEKTSFSDIAHAVNISRGNFYYHFKSKDEILDAVISSRLSNTHQMLEKWESTSREPQDRIQSFIHILLMNQVKILDYGCPVGTLCSELAKLDHTLHSKASELFTLFREWLRKQFILLDQKDDADALAMHLLARTQGIATLANAFHDKEFIAQEVAQMESWLKEISYVYHSA